MEPLNILINLILRTNIKIVIIFQEYPYKHKKVYTLLQKLGIVPLFCSINKKYSLQSDIEKNNLIDFSQLKRFNPAIISGDIDNYVDRVFHKLVSKKTLKPFYRFFSGIKNPDIKIKIYFRSFIKMEFDANVSLIHWLEQSKYRNHTIISMLDINRLGKEYWKLSKLKVFHLPIISRNKLFTLKKLILGILNFILNYNKIKNKANHKQREDKKLNLRMFKVMFFPHKSVFYGDLFLKDHFYSKDKTSSFHPKNIIHLEYSDIDIEKTKARYEEYFGLKPFYVDLHSLIDINKEQIYINILNCIDKAFIKSIIKSKISLVTVLRMASLYYGYLYFSNSIKGFENVKIALVGYDVLLPISLSLALESNGVKTIACQERFVQPFNNKYDYILDTNFVASKYISSIIQQKRENSIYATNTIPMGLLRSDKLFTQKMDTSGESDRKQIIVFDYHVINQYNYQICQPVLNWKNDHYFRKEILKLAKDFKDYDFIVRGKNIEWTNIAYFNDILDQWNNTPNITLDADYSEFYRSYELCNKSDLIIARHTSIADECISKGFEVIIHDYGINYDRYIRNYYPKIPGINFCHSYKELKAHMSSFHKNGYITNQKLKNEIIETLFDGLSDGNVQSRITQYLNKIDYQELR